jgi:hypothetical protein
MSTRAFVIAFVASAVVASGSLIGFAAQRSAARTAETRLQALEDKEAIHELMMNYGRTLDARDFAGFERLFTKDAEYGAATGQPAIRARLEAALKANGAPVPGRDWHFFFNETIKVNGDEATALSMGAFFVRGEGNKIESTMVATYRDQLVREDGMWKFKVRAFGPPSPAQAGAAPPR